MSARNRPENKEARRMEREEQSRQNGFKAAVQFAMAAARSTSNVPIEVLEDSVAYGEALLKPGISLDDALEIEGALKALRSLVVYRKLLEGAPQVFEVTSAGTQDGGAHPAHLTLRGTERGALSPGQRVIVTMTYDPKEVSGAERDTSAEQDHGAGDAGASQEGADGQGS